MYKTSKSFMLVILFTVFVNKCFSQLNQSSYSPLSIVNCSCPGISWDAVQKTLFSSTSVGSTSKQLNITDFGFNIPTNTIIKGVELTVTQATCSPEYYYDSNVQLLVAGVASGQNKATLVNFTTCYPTPYDVIYGGSNDLWSNTLTPNIVNNSNFGVTYQVVQNVAPGWCFFLIPTLTVYYETATGVIKSQSSDIASIHAYSYDGKMYVNNPTSEIIEGATIRIYNALGEVIFEEQKTVAPNEIKNLVMSNPTNGFYFVTISSSKNELIFSKKVFIGSN